MRCIALVLPILLAGSLVDRLERIRTWFIHWLIDEKVTQRSVAETYGGG